MKSAPKNRILVTVVIASLFALCSAAQAQQAEPRARLQPDGEQWTAGGRVGIERRSSDYPYQLRERH
jgi:hypothetical protein